MAPRASFSAMNLSRLVVFPENIGPTQTCSSPAVGRLSPPPPLELLQRTGAREGFGCKPRRDASSAAGRLACCSSLVVAVPVWPPRRSRALARASCIRPGSKEHQSFYYISDVERSRMCARGGSEARRELSSFPGLRGDFGLLAEDVQRAPGAPRTARERILLKPSVGMAEQGPKAKFVLTNPAHRLKLRKVRPCLERLGRTCEVLWA